VRQLRATCLCLVTMLGLAGAVALAAEPTPDPEIAKGISEVSDGDYDGAILTLDRAVRRLASNPNKMRDLAQGYLYLGIAYAGKGHEAAARARFREAVGQMGDLTLSPDQFPPKIIDLFEAAKEEVRRTASPAVQPKAPPSAETKVAPAPPAKKGGSKKKWFLIGGGGVGAVALLAAAAGNKNDTDNNTTPKEPITEHRQGDLTPEDHYRPFPFGPFPAGPWEAKVTWAPAPDEDPALEVHFLVFRSGEMFRVSDKIDARSARTTFDGAADTAYEFHVETTIPPTLPVHFDLSVTHPAP
jgi:hypothetical protein